MIMECSEEMCVVKKNSCARRNMLISTACHAGDATSVHEVEKATAEVSTLAYPISYAYSLAVLCFVVIKLSLQSGFAW